MRRFAATVSILGFLGMAAVGLACDVPTFDCAIRALVGAVILYIIALVAGRIVLNIMIDALINGSPRSGSADNAEGKQ